MGDQMHLPLNDPLSLQALLSRRVPVQIYHVSGAYFLSACSSCG